MSEEEKKAIEELKNLISKSKFIADIEINKHIAFKDIEIILKLIEKQQKEIKELKKYDYRNIKINKNNELSSIHFTEEQLDLMNLGIALYVGIPKILADKEDEETDI